MELEMAVRGRRSIRKFTSKKVPGVLVDEILDAARWAPSWGNTQPWEFYVLTGEPLAAFKEAGARMLADGLAFAPDIPMPEAWAWPGAERAIQRAGQEPAGHAGDRPGGQGCPQPALCPDGQPV